MSITATRAPSPPIRWAVARPMPCPPPDTTSTRSVKRADILATLAHMCCETVAPETDILAEAVRLPRAAEESSVPLRLIGGLAIRMHIPAGVAPAFPREYQDHHLGNARGPRPALRSLAAGPRPSARA